MYYILVFISYSRFDLRMKITHNARFVSGIKYLMPHLILCWLVSCVCAFLFLYSRFNLPKKITRKLMVIKNNFFLRKSHAHAHCKLSKVGAIIHVSFSFFIQMICEMFLIRCLFIICRRYKYICQW
jgi:hypothetical protein